MRILIINDDLPPEVLGGSGRVVLEDGRELARRGNDVIILTASKRNTRPDIPIEVNVVTIPALPFRFAHYRSVFSRRRANEVLRIIDELKPDVIHAHLLAWQIGYRWIHGVVKMGIPCFFTFHGVIPVAYWKVTTEERCLWLRDVMLARWTFNPFRNLLTRRALQKVYLLSVSDALKQYLRQFGYRTIMIVPNGVDCSFWKPTMTQTNARATLGLPQEAPLFLLGGRLGHDKGLVFLWDLWPTLQGNPHLVLAGELPLEVPDRLQSQTHIFRDQTPEEMRTLFAACDVVLIPSICFDSLPTIALEAMACECATIVADRGGAKETLLEGVTGWTLPAGKEAAWERQLQWCIDHRKALPAMGAQARAHVQEHFSLSAHVQRLLTLYEEALQR